MWTKIIINFLLIFSAYLSVIVLYIVVMTIRTKTRKTDLRSVFKNHAIGGHASDCVRSFETVSKHDSASTGFKKVQKLH